MTCFSHSFIYPSIHSYYPFIHSKITLNSLSSGFALWSVIVVDTEPREKKGSATEGRGRSVRCSSFQHCWRLSGRLRHGLGKCGSRGQCEQDGKEGSVKTETEVRRGWRWRALERFRTSESSHTRGYGSQELVPSLSWMATLGLNLLKLLGQLRSVWRQTQLSSKKMLPSSLLVVCMQLNRKRKDCQFDCLILCRIMAQGPVVQSRVKLTQD